MFDPDIIESMEEEISEISLLPPNLDVSKFLKEHNMNRSVFQSNSSITIEPISKNNSSVAECKLNIIPMTNIAAIQNDEQENEIQIIRQTVDKDQQKIIRNPNAIKGMPASQNKHHTGPVAIVKRTGLACSNSKYSRIPTLFKNVKIFYFKSIMIF